MSDQEKFMRTVMALSILNPKHFSEEEINYIFHDESIVWNTGVNGDLSDDLSTREEKEKAAEICKPVSLNFIIEQYYQ